MCLHLSPDLMKLFNGSLLLAEGFDFRQPAIEMCTLLSHRF
jgi:hypothetical protein